jgi:hypothetical protein
MLDRKLKLFVVDIRFIEFEYQIIRLLAQTMPFNAELVGLQADAEQKLLDYNNFVRIIRQPDEDRLLLSDELLEEKLAETYQLRCDYWKVIADSLYNLLVLIKDEKRSEPVDALDELDAFCQGLEIIDVYFDSVVYQINSSGEVLEAFRINFEQTVNNTLQQLLTFAQGNEALIAGIVQKQKSIEAVSELKTFFGKDYKRAFRLQESILLWTTWNQILETQEAMLAEQAEGSDYRYAYRLYHSVLNQKHQVFREFYRVNRKNQAIIALKLSETLSAKKKDQPDISSAEMILFLKSKRQSSITNAEEIISQFKHYSRLSGSLAYVSQIWTGTTYVKYWELIYKLANEATQQKCQLTDAYYTAFINIIGPVSVSALFDVLLPRYLSGSVSPHLYLSMANIVLPNFDRLLKFGYRLHLDERRMTQFIYPLLNQLMALAINIGLHTYRLGFDWESVIYLLTSYLLGSCVRSGVGQLMDVSSKDYYLEQKKEALFVVQKIVGEYFGYLLGSGTGKAIYRISEPSVRTLFFKPPPAEKLLKYKKVCLTYPKDCRKAALEVLGLDLGATFKEIKKQFHQLERKYHPDQLTGDLGKHIQFSKAYQLLSLLVDRDEKSKTACVKPKDEARLAIAF